MSEDVDDDVDDHTDDVDDEIDDVADVDTTDKNFLESKKLLRTSYGV